MPSKTIKNINGAQSTAGFYDQPLLNLRQAFLSFVQGLFVNAPKGQGCFHWDQDKSITEFVIRDETPIDVSNIGDRPACNLTRGPVEFSTVGMNDMVSLDLETETMRKSAIIVGFVSLNVCAKVDLQCEYIAWVIAEHIWLLRHLFLKHGFFDIGQQPTIGSPSPAGSLVANDQGKEWVAVQVMVPYKFQRTSQYTPLNHQLISNFMTSVIVPNTVVGTGTVFQNNSLPPGFDAGENVVPAEDPQLTAARIPSAENPLKTVLQVTGNQAVRLPFFGGSAVPIQSGAVEQSQPQGSTVVRSFKID